MECQEFSVLPPVEELGQFILEEVLSEEENKGLLQQIESLFPDEKSRKYLLQMKDDESTEKLAELLAPGVIWPGYPNEEKGRDVMVTGYSMQKPTMDITVSGIGWWTLEPVVRSVVEKWGEVKELNRVKCTINGHAMNTDRWAVKLVKNKDIVIPPVVIHAGSDRSSQEREMWKVFYRGVIKVCYHCLKEGHLGRDCQDDPVTMEYLASQSSFEEAPAAHNEEDIISGDQRTFAQIVKHSTFVETRLARQRAAELKLEEVAARVRDERMLRENRKKEKEKKQRRETMENTESETDSESYKPWGKERRGRGETSGHSGRQRGFSIPRADGISDWNEEAEGRGGGGVKKRPAPSPLSAPHDKAVKTTPSGSRSGSRSRPPGNL